MLLLWLAAALLVTPARAEDGHDLWLRFPAVAAGSPLSVTEIVGTPAFLASGGIAMPTTLTLARDELIHDLRSLSGLPPTGSDHVTQDGALIPGTPASSPLIATLKLNLKSLGPEGYLIRSISVDHHRAIVIAANTDIGVLYGTFHFLRLIQTRKPLTHLDITEQPQVQHRLLNHWDNLDGSVERGYSGSSLWNWQKLPDYLDPRYTDYARACASIGINGTVLTNVNASAFLLTPLYLQKIAALATVFRPYGLRVYIPARFSAPVEIGGLTTADPNDPAASASASSAVVRALLSRAPSGPPHLRR